MEIELRARLTNGPEFLQSLRRRVGRMQAGSITQDDRYFRHEADRKRRIIVRIRRTETSAIVTFKSRATGSDTAWLNVDLPLNEPNDLERLLLSGGYVPVVRIRKRRWTFRFRGMELNVDQVRGLGWYIEIEANGTARKRRQLETRIECALADLGIRQSNIIRRGYVTLAMSRGKKE